MSSPNHGIKLSTYVTGFVLSLILTMTAYLLVVDGGLSKNLLVGLVVSLALVQFVVQLVYFLHLNQEGRPRWNLLVFGFMAGVVAILVFGSLWIMTNLNYHGGHPVNRDHHGKEIPNDKVNDYIREDERIKR